MSKKTVKDWYKITNQAAMPELLIYGYIGPWDEIDYVGFQAEIKTLVTAGHKQIKMRIHCGGGSVIEGLPIYDCLNTSGLDRIVEIEGMAASMASVLAQAASPGKRRIHESGTIMIHRVKGSEWGNADELRAYADLIDDREKRIKQIFIKNTGQTAETVDGWFAKNTDFWVNAEQALALGLVDEIIKAPADAQVLPFNKLEKMTEKAAYEALSNSLNSHDKSQNNNMEKLQVLIMAALAARGISVAENATEQQTANHVTNAFKALDDKVTELQNKLKEQAEAQADALCNAAKTAGKYKADDAEGLKELKELAIANYSAAAKMVDKLPGAGKSEQPKNVTVNVTTTDSGKKSDADPENRENWSFEDYQKNDPAALAKMQDEEPERFEKLVASVRNSLKQKGAIA